MDKSESIKELAAALVKAQAEIAGAVKDKTNPHYRSQYADLASVSEACKGPLNKHGLAVVQTAEPSDDNKLRLTTSLLHVSGEWIGGTITMTLPKNDPQGYGSAMTYARRYGLAALVGVCPTEDDDGNGACVLDKPAAKPEPKPAPKPAPKPEAKPTEQVNPDIEGIELALDDEFKQAMAAAFVARGVAEGDREHLKRIVTEIKRARQIKSLLNLNNIERVEFIAAIRRGEYDGFVKSTRKAA